MRFNIPLDLDKIVLFKYEDPIKTSKTVGDKIQVSLKRKRKANKLRFLMILQDVDFKKCIYSKYDIIMYNKTNFPGMLTIERFDESNNFPYTIQGPAMPRQLYIMLPKECIYVTSNNFTEKLIRSKLRELMDIFIVLQAKKIKFFYSDSQKSSSNIGVEIGSLHPNISSTIDNRIDNEETKQYGFLYEMHFEKPTAPIDLKKFLEPYYYYLPEEPEWLQIIKRRVDYATEYDKYCYKSTNTKILKRKFINKLQILNFNVDFDWEKYNKFSIDYEIEYYPITSSLK
jgi:hypothetical protein